MKAVIITQSGGPEVLAIQDVATPVPIGEQVLIKVHAAGLNRADISQRLGRYPAPAGVPTQIPGLEFAGEIVGKGPQVTQWEVGQRVMGIVAGGAQAEYLLSHQGLLVEIPFALDYVQAAAIPEVFMTAYDALFTQANLQMGERVLIHAAGSGVGTAAIQLAKAAGAHAFGTSRTPDKLEQAKALGLALALPAVGFAAEVQSFTKGKGVDVVLDFVGGSTLNENFQALAPWGRMVLLAIMGGTKAEINLALLMNKRIQLRGSTLRSRSLEEKLAVTRRFSIHVLPLFARGVVKPIVSHVFSLAEIADAHQMMGENRNFGKLIVRIVP